MAWLFGRRVGATNVRSSRVLLCILVGASLALAASADDRPALLGKVTLDLEEPNCLEKVGAEWRWPVCYRRCIKKAWEWRFWVTNYNVGSSLGKGEHQGIAIIEMEYEFDDRFKKEDGVPHPTGKAYMDRVRIPMSKEVANHALCVIPKVPFEGDPQANFIYNHGRTLAVNMSVGGWDVLDSWSPPMDVPTDGSFMRGPLTYKEWADPQSEKLREIAVTRDCMAEIKDGYCDAVCGNCSYVLPKAEPGLYGYVTSPLGLQVLDVSGQDTQFTNPERRSTEIRYVRTDKDKPRPRVHDSWVDTLPVLDEDQGFTGGYKDPFTHCLPPNGEQALATILVRGTGEERILTGIYGHNSNTDAEAEFMAFLACRYAPKKAEEFGVKFDVPLACNKCGLVERGSKEQSPCLAQTNTAAAKWLRMDGEHNVDDDKLGKHPSGKKMPVCRFNDELIYGM